jgi:predicted metal-binding membrane protein
MTPDFDSATPSAATHLPRLRRRDRIAVLTGLSGVTLVAWAYLIRMAMQMDAMAVDGVAATQGAVGMSMGSGGMAGMAALRAWSGFDFVLMFAMWAVMMVGMMVPTATPMTLLYAQVARKAARQGSTLAPTAVFVAGYVAIWTLFSLGATLAQWGLDRAALLSPMMVTTSPVVGAGLLIAAGIYQLTPIKDTCLEHCRAPAHFMAAHWLPGVSGAFRMGMHHGAFCLGCCWLLMGLLFFGGVMNLLWIAAISLFVLLEKVIPHGLLGGRVAGIAMIVAGGLVWAGWLG